MPRAMQERAARLDVVRTPRKVSAPIWLALATAAALAPFLNKAFHIDDPLFLWMAEQITRHPLDPYGFTVNWAGPPQPMWVAMQNPPLCSYFIAAVSALFGSNEIALHLSCWGRLLSRVVSVDCQPRLRCSRFARPSS